MRITLASSAAILVFLWAGLLGGAGWSGDVAVIRAFVGWRSSNPETTSLVILFTQLGGAPFLLGVGALATGWLALRRRDFRSAASLAATLIVGRIAVEALKLTFDRPRPSLDAHPVFVFSQSFPSGHAGNSMITFCALALFLAPQGHRRAALLAAVVLAFGVGATRPMLGVHWPSDVLGGWLLGAVVVSLGWHFRLRPQTEA